jgi:hypothetical protein
VPSFPDVGGVPHKKLLHKLTAYGINGPIHAWLTQFLTARTMQVVLEGQTTNQVTVDSGVPQGTVLELGFTGIPGPEAVV